METLVFGKEMGVPTTLGTTKITWNDLFIPYTDFYYTDDTNVEYVIKIKASAIEKTIISNSRQNGNTKYFFTLIENDVKMVELQFGKQENNTDIFIRKDLYTQEELEQIDWNNVTIELYIKTQEPIQKESKTCIVRFAENIACMVTFKYGEFSLEKLGGE